MAKVGAIKAEPRNNLGTHATRKFRKNGQLPAVIYGHKKETVSVAIPEEEFVHLFHEGSHLFELQIGSEKENVLVKKVQYNYLGTELIHVDFNRVDLNERVKVEVSLILKGVAVGTQAGGVLQQILMELEIECVVTEIPENIRVNISKLGLNEQLKAKDIEIPAGAKLITDGELIVATVAEVKEEVAAAPVEGAVVAEPEVISKGKEEEAAEGEAAPEAGKAEKK
jgi:large subunit ribosomal protein L25